MDSERAVIVRFDSISVAVLLEHLVERMRFPAEQQHDLAAAFQIIERRERKFEGLRRHQPTPVNNFGLGAHTAVAASARSIAPLSEASPDSACSHIG